MSAAPVKIEIVKEWDGNERVHESRNGRTYVSAGRWVWFVTVDGAIESDHERKGDALIRAAELTAGVR